MRVLSNLAFILLILGALVLCYMNIELYGEIYRFLPLLCFLPLLKPLNMQKIFELFIALAIASLVTYICKFVISHLALNANLDDLLSFAKRPINGEFKGFPSGHATTAFVGVAFAYLYYGLKWKIAFLAFAILVGISRILSLWHTPLQVFVGSIVGFFAAIITLKLLARFEVFKKLKMRFIKEAN